MEDYDKEESKLLMKMKENPFMPIGLAGLVGAVIYGAVQYKNRGKMSTSVYLMQLRVGAQSMVVGALGLGVTYSLITNLLKGKDASKKE